MIKSDKWIRRMAAATRMIEPFEPGQVREVDGRKIVSYGTSSYGYDIRCSREFKIFTNINATIVDPKNFDEKSFVDFEGDVCILIDGGTFSTAADLATVAHANRLATFFGEETGGGYEGNNSGSSEFLRLPNSGLGVSVPHWNYRTAGVGPGHEGPPDHFPLMMKAMTRV